MKIFRKILNQILVLVLVMNLAVVGFATENNATPETFDITVTNNTAEITHTYEVYQIFAGAVKESTDPSLDSNDVLSDVTWGTGVDSAKYDAIENTLKDNATSPLFAAAYAAVEADPEQAGVFSEMGQAAKIAYVLAKYKTNFELVKEFSRVICANLSGRFETLGTTDNKVYTKSGFEGGYYLIKDQDGSLKDTNETYTSNMLQVVGNTNINAKGSTVSVDKGIQSGNQLVEAEDFNIGDDINYVLTGTMPYNYNRFTFFHYTFVDTMSKGLDYVEGSLKVYLVNSNVKAELPELCEHNGNSVNWTSSVEENADGETIITVDFPDMKQITDRTIDAQTQVVVEYTARLNDSALIGTSNPNEVKLVFNNNPYSNEEYGETPEDIVHAFVFELDINKIDGSNTDTKLQGAQFILWREVLGQKEYAVVDEDGWLTGWTTYKDAAEKGDNEGEIASQLTTGADGLIKVNGLKADVYFLQETVAPEGYNLDPNVIEVDIDAVVKENEAGEGEVESLTITVNGGNVHNGSNGAVSMTVVNNQGATLPETGGIGTTIFYVVGGFMVVAALVILVTKKRMASEA